MTHEELKEKLDNAIALQHWWNAAIYKELLLAAEYGTSLEASARGIIDASPQWVYETLSDLFSDEALEGFEP